MWSNPVFLLFVAIFLAFGISYGLLWGIDKAVRKLYAISSFLASRGNLSTVRLFNRSVNIGLLLLGAGLILFSMLDASLPSLLRQAIGLLGFCAWLIVLSRYPTTISQSNEKSNGSV